MSDVAAQQSGIQAEAPAVPGWIIVLLASSCGLIVANLYYAQPLIGPIAETLGLSPALAGLIVTMTQVGYVTGLLFVVPLGDLVETRRLVLTLMAVCFVSLLAGGLSFTPLPFLLAALVTGLGSVTVQILVPYAAHLAPEARRGQVVGSVTSGLMLGIMLARPAASFVTHMLSWRAIFFLSAAVMAGLAAVLARALPRRQPVSGIGYAGLLVSMGHLLRTTPVLRRRALYQAALFGMFSLFWTTVPLLLAGLDYRLSQTGIALFALAGVTGAVAAPLAGMVADRGWTRPATAFAMLCSSGSFLLSHAGHRGSASGLAALVGAAILVDFAITTNLVMGQRAIFGLNPAHRSRLNGLYMAIFFLGGALGSALGGWAFVRGGWNLVTWIGVCVPLVALGYFATEGFGQEKSTIAVPSSGKQISAR